MNYSYIFNNQNIQKSSDFIYLRANTEFAGNVLSLFGKYMQMDTTGSDSYQLFGTPFAQYFKIDFDFRYYHEVSKREDIVYRLFAGIGYPYGNLTTLPFAKKYYSGGANSIRAWEIRSVGPGSYSIENQDIHNQTADIKLEANFEYRFKMFWLLEGAFFIDAGNIWEIHESADRPGASFAWNRFYKEIAVGTGLGARFDFKFFVFRLDCGLKLRNPTFNEKKRWIPQSRAFNYDDDIHFTFQIGYPF